MWQITYGRSALFITKPLRNRCWGRAAAGPAPPGRAPARRAGRPRRRWCRPPAARAAAAARPRSPRARSPRRRRARGRHCAAPRAALRLAGELRFGAPEHDLVAATQQPRHLARRADSAIAASAARKRLDAGEPHLALDRAVVLELEHVHERAQRHPLDDERAEHDRERGEQDQVAVRETRPAGSAGRKRERRGERHDPAHAAPADDRRGRASTGPPRRARPPCRPARDGSASG